MQSGSVSQSMLGRGHWKWLDNQRMSFLPSFQCSLVFLISVQRCVELVTRAKRPLIVLGSQSTLPPVPAEELRAALDVRLPTHSPKISTSDACPVLILSSPWESHVIWVEWPEVSWARIILYKWDNREGMLLRRQIWSSWLVKLFHFHY